MKFFKSKKFIIFLLIIIATAGFFYVYSAMKMEKTYAFFKPLEVLETFENLPVVKAAVDYSKKTVDKVGEKIKNQFSESAESTSEIVSEKTDSFKNSAFNFVKENMNGGLNAVGKVLGVNSDLVDTINTNSTSSINNEEKCK